MQKSKTFRSEESINPYKVEIDIDRCHPLQEQKTFFKYSSVASVLVAVCAIVLICLSIFPAASSIRKAEKILNKGAGSNLDQISFGPINDLVQKALRSFELEKQSALIAMAAQVSHDIRSPLSALNMALSSTQDLPLEKTKIIKSATTRINEIANELLLKSKQALKTHSNDGASVKQFTVVTDVVPALLEEKRTEYANYKDLNFIIKIDQGTKLIAQIEPGTLARVLSNLLNNSVEASDFKGVVTLIVREESKFIRIEILDQGCGIHEDILARIGKRGFSHGKEGSGLGLFCAREALESIGGRFALHSRVGEGTLVILHLPRA